MLNTLKHLFDSLTPEPASPSVRSGEATLELATAVLLVEVMRADSGLDDAERRAVVAALHQRFDLADDAVERLVELAREKAEWATDTFGFTSRINDAFDMEQKIWMIEQMWRVAYADGKLEARENHLMRKVAGLLYVPHGAYINAKMRARDAQGTE